MGDSEQGSRSALELVVEGTPILPARENGRAATAKDAVRRRAASQSGIDGFQRARVLQAMADIACEEGPERATLTRIVARAHVKRQAFYELFGSREACLLALVDDTLARVAARVLRGYRSQGQWVEQLRAGLFELLLCVQSEPQLARVCLACLNADDPEMRARRARLVAAVVPMLERGRVHASVGADPPEIAGEACVGALASLLYSRLLAREPFSASEQLGPLMAVLVLPYLGSAAAREQLHQSVPVPVSPASRPVPGEPVLSWHAPVRVTYRTARVLDVIATNPGANNRALAEGAGIRDQGQISRLLARLAQHGLVENAGIGPGGNAWRLTDEGAAFTRTIGLERDRDLTRECREAARAIRLALTV
jgi:AcrR family transcriptional regulator